MTEKQQIQVQINELQERLDKCDEVEPFTCRGTCYTARDGSTHYDSATDYSFVDTFNYWESKEIAEKAYKLQLRHRVLLSYVSQQQTLGEGHWYVYKEGGHWYTGESLHYYPDKVMMTKQTADLMLEAIENGSLDLEHNYGR